MVDLVLEGALLLGEGRAELLERVVVLARADLRLELGLEAGLGLRLRNGSVCEYRNAREGDGRLRTMSSERASCQLE